MSAFLTIRALHEEGLANKAIARRLGLDPRTVRRHVRRIDAGAEHRTRARVPSKLDPLRDAIASRVERGLSAVQIHQELSSRADFGASYETVKRLVRRLRRDEPEVYCRLSFHPGEEAQIDFGEVGRLPLDEEDPRVGRKAHLFVMTLCYSRMAYYELVWDQTVPTFLGAIRRAFEFFGGVPERLKPDNLRSAVLRNQLGERYYQEDFFRFCRHYGCVPDAARPYTPTDKGRVESTIGYAKGNCFRGRTFGSFDRAQAYLRHWRDEVANVRIHGTTRRRPVDLFEDEQGALRPLPEETSEVSTFGLHRVRKDIHVAVRGNFYSVPWQRVGQKVLVRLTETEVTVFAEGQLLARHVRSAGKGETVTDPAHLPATKRLATQEIHRRRVLRIRAAGPHAAEYLHRLHEGPFVVGDQVSRLVGLLEEYGERALDRACRRALHYGAIDGARRVERILSRGLQDLPLPPRRPLPVAASATRDFPRPLREYERLLVVGAGEEVA